MALREKLRMLHKILFEENASIIATHIRGECNLVADALSRVHVGDAWMLKPSVF